MLYEISEKIMKLEAEGKKIIKLNLGDPDQSTPNEIIEAAYEAMKHGKTKYSSSVGEKRLREELASIHQVSADNVVITPGSKWAIFHSNPLLDSLRTNCKKSWGGNKIFEDRNRFELAN